MVHVLLMFLSEWRGFPSASCLAEGGGGGCFLSASVTRKDNSAHGQTSLSIDTINSVLRHEEVSRAKDLPAPSRITQYHIHV